MVRFLFPHSFKLPGLIILSLSLISGVVYLILDGPEPELLNSKAFSIFGDNIFLGKTNNLLDEILSLGLIIGALLSGFSREKVEDEYINQIRLESLVWAMYINFAILIIAIILISGIDFMNVMMYNMFTVLLFFVIRFHIILWAKNRRSYE
jgi:hypothetical protein